MQQTAMAVCTRCNQLLPVQAFAFRRDVKIGRRRRCRHCDNAQRSGYRSKPAKVADYTTDQPLTPTPATPPPPPPPPAPPPTGSPVNGTSTGTQVVHNTIDTAILKAIRGCKVNRDKSPKYITVDGKAIVVVAPYEIRQIIAEGRKAWINVIGIDNWRNLGRKRPPIKHHHKPTKAELAATVTSLSRVK